MAYMCCEYCCCKLGDEKCSWRMLKMVKRVMKTRRGYLPIKLSDILTLSWMVKDDSRSCLCRFNNQQNMLLSILQLENLIINISWRAKLAHHFLLFAAAGGTISHCFPFSFSVCGCSQLLECAGVISVHETHCGFWKTAPLERTVTSWEGLVTSHVLQYMFHRTIVYFDRESEALEKKKKKICV